MEPSSSESKKKRQERTEAEAVLAQYVRRFSPDHTAPKTFVRAVGEFNPAPQSSSSPSTGAALYTVGRCDRQTQSRSQSQSLAMQVLSQQEGKVDDVVVRVARQGVHETGGMNVGSLFGLSETDIARRAARASQHTQQQKEDGLVLAVSPSSAAGHVAFSLCGDNAPAPGVVEQAGPSAMAAQEIPVGIDDGGGEDSWTDSEEETTGRAGDVCGKEDGVGGLSTSLHVAGIPKDVQEQDLLELFSRFGPVTGIKIWRYGTEEERRQHKDNFAFVTFLRRGDAEKAFATVPLRVSWSRNVNHSPFPLFLVPRSISSGAGSKVAPLLSWPISPSSLSEDASPFDEQKSPSVRVSIPKDPKVRGAIDRLASLVACHGKAVEVS